MLTIKDLDDRQDIKNIVVKGLKAKNPDTLSGFLYLGTSEKVGQDYTIGLRVQDEINDDMYIVFDDLFPSMNVPKFLIDGKVFVTTDMSIQDTWEWVLAMAVIASSEVKLKFQRKGNKLIVIISIGGFTAKKRMPLEMSKSLFELAE